jgi:ATP-dependent Clp protease ATP-binding subunit ClpB
MRIDKLTNQFQKALADAQSLAVGLDNSTIEPLHLLKAMLAEGSATHLFKQSGGDIAKIKTTLDQELEQLAKINNNNGDIGLSVNLNKLLNICDKYAQQQNDSFIATETFLLALVDSNDKANDVLKYAGVDKKQLKTAIENLRNGQNGC